MVTNFRVRATNFRSWQRSWRTVRLCWASSCTIAGLLRTLLLRLLIASAADVSPYGICPSVDGKYSEFGISESGNKLSCPDHARIHAYIDHGYDVKKVMCPTSTTRIDRLSKNQSYHAAESPGRWRQGVNLERSRGSCIAYGH